MSKKRGKKRSKRLIMIVLIDMITVLLISLTCYYIYHNVEENSMRYGLIFLLICIGLLSLLFNLRPEADDMPSKITSIALLNEEDEVIREWNMEGEVSLLIGKDTGGDMIDIDLMESAYATLIDVQHAVMNYAGKDWYIEDLYSTNGISIEKQSDMIRYKISKERPCKIEKGDILYIANTKLLIS